MTKPRVWRRLILIAASFIAGACANPTEPKPEPPPEAWDTRPWRRCIRDSTGQCVVLRRDTTGLDKRP